MEIGDWADGGPVKGCVELAGAEGGAERGDG